MLVGESWIREWPWKVKKRQLYDIISAVTQDSGRYMLLVSVWHQLVDL